MSTQDDPFYGECPHCNQCEFHDEDHWFEHLCACDQELDEEA